MGRGFEGKGDAVHEEGKEAVHEYDTNKRMISARARNCGGGEAADHECGTITRINGALGGVRWGW